jgi:hypothetical protein
MCRWFQMLPPHPRREVRDYAMVFRHTHVGRHRDVLFVIAGFTERSTAVAAQYLMHEWKALWEQHVKGTTVTGSRGDFLLLIEGPSDPRQIDHWRLILEVTPRSLHDLGIHCEWADRIPGRY